MSQFVVTSGGSTTALNERRSPSRTAALTGTTHPVGTILTSLEQRAFSVFGSGPGNVAGSEVWQRVGVNRWVNQSILGASNVHNMVRTTKLNNPQNLTVSPPGLSKVINARRGPGTVFDNHRTIPTGSRVTATHTATPPAGFPLRTGGAWVRIGNREWVYRSLLR